MKLKPSGSTLGSLTQTKYSSFILFYHRKTKYKNSLTTIDNVGLYKY